MSKKYVDDPKYWDDFCKAQVLAGTTAAYLYAGVRKLMRAERLAKAKKAKRRRASMVTAAH